jgi:hypothetical protein
MRNVAFVLLGFWLMMDATLKLGQWHLTNAKPVLAGIALVSGSLLLFNVIQSKFSEIGLLLLSIWLIINSIISIFHVTFPYSSFSIAVLAIVTGLFLIMRK